MTPQEREAFEAMREGLAAIETGCAVLSTDGALSLSERRTWRKMEQIASAALRLVAAIPEDKPDAVI